MDEAVKIAELGQTVHDNTRRISALEKRQANLDKLATTMTVFDTEQKHIKQDVSEIKTDVKSLKDKPGKRWENVVEKLIWLVVGAVIALAMAQIGINI